MKKMFLGTLTITSLLFAGCNSGSNDSKSATQKHKDEKVKDKPADAAYKKDEGNKDDSKITVESFDKIQIGMSHNEVVDIFGGNKGVLSGMSKVNGELHPLYIWMVNNDLTNSIDVVFDDNTDKVIEKRNGLKKKKK